MPKVSKRRVLAYAALIEGLIKQVQDVITKRLDLSKVARKDAIDPVLQAQIDGIEAQLADEEFMQGVVDRLNEYFRNVKKANQRSQKTIFGIELDEELLGLVENFTTRNVALITSLAGEQVTRTRQILDEANRVGLRVEAIQAQLQDAFGLSRSRARLIARDQTLTFNAQVTRATHERAGIDKYAWTTAGDERVREEHEELDGRVFSYTQGPKETGGEHPGEPIMCRCFAYPVIEGLNENTSITTSGNVFQLP